MKKIVSFLLAASLLVTSMAFVTSASDFPQLPVGTVEKDYTPDGTPIRTVEEFKAMNPNENYYLANDIDFSGTVYNGPIYTRQFRGVLDGNGYSLLNITISVGDNDAGVFATSFGGTLKNITFGSPESPVSVTGTGSGKSVACVAGTVSDRAVFENVKLYASVKGEGKTAGFFAYAPRSTVTIKNCEVNGTISGNPAAGFATTSSDGDKLTLSFFNCTNNAAVTGKNLGAGGLYCAQSSVSSQRVTEITVRYCSNTGTISANDWRAGGIIGEFNESSASVLDLKYCMNVGTIIMTGPGGYASGIVGGCYSQAGPTMTISHVYNAGEIINTAVAGNAYAISFATAKNPQNKVSYAYYLSGTCSLNFTESNCQRCPDVAALMQKIGEWKTEENTPVFVLGENDTYPVFSWKAECAHRHTENYNCGAVICDDCKKAITPCPMTDYTVTTVPTSSWIDGYTLKECKHCPTKVETPLGTLSAGHMTPDENGVYTVKTANNLMWYANMVNTGKLKGSETLVLANDISLKGITYIPIANNNTPTGKSTSSIAFTGTFDGGYHTISDISIDKSASQGGLFGMLGNGAVVRNLRIDKANIKANGLCGAVAGTTRSADSVLIDSCIVTNSTIVSTDKYAGAIIGSTEGAVNVRIYNCVAADTTVTGNTVGAFCGEGSAVLGYNCYANVSFGNGSTEIDSFAQGASLSYCYYVATATYKGRTGSPITKSTFTRGEVAYKIATFAICDKWGQKLGETEYPVFGEPAVSRIRLGSKFVFTSDRLTTGSANFSPFVITRDGKTILYVVAKKNADTRFVDTDISVTYKIKDGDRVTKELSPLDFIKAGYAYDGTSYSTPDEGYVLYEYVLSVDPDYTVVSVTVGDVGYEPGGRT